MLFLIFLILLPLFRGDDFEFEWITKFNRDFSKFLNKHNLDSYNLKVENTTLENVVGVMGASASKDPRELPKADIVFIDKNKNRIGFTSLKEGNNISRFQQWGGISKISNTEVSDFIKRLKSYLDSKGLRKIGVLPKDVIWSEIQSQEVKNQAMWGIRYNSSSFSEENVQFIMQGFPKLTIADNCVELGVSHLITRHNCNNIDAKSPYRPVFCALYRSGRNDFKIPNTRVFAYPAKGRIMNIDITDYVIPA